MEETPPEQTEPRPARKYLPLLWIVNLSIAAFFAVLFLSMTSRMAIEQGIGVDVIYTDEGGATQALYRYAGMSVCALLLQGVMAVLNFGVAPFLVAEEKVTPTCLKIAFASLGLIMAIALAGLALGWPRV